MTTTKELLEFPEIGQQGNIDLSSELVSAILCEWFDNHFKERGLRSLGHCNVTFDVFDQKLEVATIPFNFVNMNNKLL